MKNLIAALMLFVGLALPAQAVEWRPSFVSYSTFTLPGAGLYAWGFKNTSAVYDVRVTRIDVGSCNDGTAVSSGLVQFDLYKASSLTSGGTVQVSTHALNNDEFPANVVASTGPVSVVIEGKGVSGANQLPILSPLFINADETATANFVDGVSLDSQNRQPIVLPKNGTKGLVLKQKKVGTSDFTAGCGFARLEFTIK